MLVASNDVSRMWLTQDTGAGDWPYVQSPIVIVPTGSFIPDGVDVVGVASVVG